MEHHVTVGVDGSRQSRAAALWGAREAALRNTWTVPSPTRP